MECLNVKIDGMARRRIGEWIITNTDSNYRPSGRERRR